MPSNQTPANAGTLFGHPVGLFTLFFAEMWERFSYYGMRALLVFYMSKGFLKYGDSQAYTVFGAYCALVYMTPFFGGMLADRLLGQRRAVILGGLLMAAGQAMMMVENAVGFYTALALLICGNGFFKPNISTIVGALYPQGSRRRDAGFTIFYMGVNLGAAMSPLLCGYVGETFGWNRGFGLATLGMLIGLAVFVNWIPPFGIGGPPDRERLRRRPVLITQLLIVLGSLAAAGSLLAFYPANPFSIGLNITVALSLLTAAVVAVSALRSGEGGLITVEWAVYGGTILAVPVFMLLVSGFSTLRSDGKPYSIVPESAIRRLNADSLMTTQLAEMDKVVAARSPDKLKAFQSALEKLHQDEDLTDGQLATLRPALAAALAGHWDAARAKVAELQAVTPKGRALAALATVLTRIAEPAGLTLFLAGFLAFSYLIWETFRLDRIARERMFVVLVLTFFSIVFWSFYEQAGSSLNNFADRNVDRVFEHDHVTRAEVGKTIQLQPTQEQLGYHNGDQLFTLDVLSNLREVHQKKTALARAQTPAPAGAKDADGGEDFKIPWKVTPDDVGMGIARRKQEVPASTFQSVNAILILVFGLPLTMLWTVLGRWGREPSTPVKFALGLFQLGLGFAAFWYGARIADGRGMVAMGWLLLGYLLHTTGELCLSPVGLSMVTRLSPTRLVATVMGSWFLATAFSELLAGIIAQFTGVNEAGGKAGAIPPPIETVHVYGGVYGTIALCAVGSAVICFALAPLLTRWMHTEAEH